MVKSGVTHRVLAFIISQYKHLFPLTKDYTELISFLTWSWDRGSRSLH